MKTYLIETASGNVLHFTSSKPLAINYFEVVCAIHPDVVLLLKEEDENNQVVVLKKSN